MRSRTPIFLFATALCSLSVLADSNDEQAAMAVLEDSGAAPAAKDAALLQLKRTGAATALPRLVSLLEDEDHWQWALNAMETMPCPEAGLALCAALRSTAGGTKAAVAHALGERRERPAVPDLVKLLADKDPMVAAASAQALGRIGGNDAAGALKKVRLEAPEPVRRAVANALLECAAHDPGLAPAIHAELNRPTESDPVRAAAFRGMVLSSGEHGVALVCDALRGGDAAVQVAAVPLVRELQGANATQQFAAVLTATAPAVQVALLEALAERGDPAAAAAVAGLTQNSEARVRIAAVRALGELGDASHAPMLAEALAATNDGGRDAARHALQSLHRGDVGAALVALIEKSRPEIQVELIPALAQRGEKAAVPALLKLAQSEDAKTGIAAVRALQELATGTQVEALLDLIVHAKSDASCEAAEAMVVAVAARGGNRDVLAGAAVNAMQGAEVMVRCALLRTAGQIGGPQALAALQAGANDPSQEIRDAAVRTMANHAGIEALPQLLALARDASSQTHRVLASRGYWRVVALAEKLPAQERLKLCQDGLAAAQRPDEKRLGLVELGKVALPAALELAEKLGVGTEVKAEAELAAAQIRSRMAGAQPESEAGTGRKQDAPFIRDWLVCGPYSQEGITGAERLFDIVFDPEKPGETVPWKPVPPADMVDLLAIFPGKADCAAYLRTEIVSPQACDATLLLGSDDGVKAWLNGAVVHCNNTDRNAVADQDAAQAKLRKGANILMLKITQGGGGWSAHARFAGPDGRAIPGLLVKPAAAPVAH